MWKIFTNFARQIMNDLSLAQRTISQCELTRAAHNLGYTDN